MSQRTFLRFKLKNSKRTSFSRHELFVLANRLGNQAESSNGLPNMHQWETIERRQQPSPAPHRSGLRIQNFRSTRNCMRQRTHGGYLLWLAWRVRPACGNFTVGEKTKAISQESLDETTSREFFLCGMYRNESAQQLSLWTSPYAGLCGSNVTATMQTVIRDHFRRQGGEI